MAFCSTDQPDSDRSAQGDIATHAGRHRQSSALRIAMQHGEGEAAARAVAGQHDRLRRDALGDQMAIGVDAVAHRGGKRELRREAIVERERGRLAGLRKPRDQRRDGSRGEPAI